MKLPIYYDAPMNTFHAADFIICNASSCKQQYDNFYIIHTMHIL